MEYTESFLNEFDYTDDAKKYLLDSMSAVMADKRAAAMLGKAVAAYRADYKCDFMPLFRDNRAIAETASVPVYTVDFLILISLSERLRELYTENGIALTVFHSCMCDLLYKCTECKLVHGVWGTFVTSWFGGFYSLRRFAFGKLQFEPVRFGSDYHRNGVDLNPESIVINVHIPRTGSSLDSVSRKASYREAAEFFAKRKDTCGVFVCWSWLLFPRHYEMLPPESNIIGFMNDYDIFENGCYDSYEERWRLFDTMEPDISRLPDNTTLRRKYIALMRNGEKTGWGRGVYAPHF